MRILSVKKSSDSVNLPHYVLECSVESSRIAN